MYYRNKPHVESKLSYGNERKNKELSYVIYQSIVYHNIMIIKIN